MGPLQDQGLQDLLALLDRRSPGNGAGLQSMMGHRTFRLKGPRWTHPVNRALRRISGYLPHWARRIRWRLDGLLREQVDGDSPDPL
jgi:hypothetical protein